MDKKAQQDDKSKEFDAARQQRIREAKIALEQRLSEADIELRPDSMDQHFMVDTEVLDQLVDGIVKSDTVLEIGAGIGILTEEICERAGKVYSVELDKRFEPALDALKEQNPNLEIIWGDGLQVEIPEDVNAVVANPPFAIMEPLLKKLATVDLDRVSLTMGERTWRAMVSPLTSEDFTAMSLYVQSQYNVVSSGEVPNDAFFPEPGGKFFQVQLESKRLAQAEGRTSEETSPQITAIMEQFASFLINNPTDSLERTLRWILENNRVFNKSAEKYKDFSKLTKVEDLGIPEDVLKKALGTLNNHEIRRALTTLAGRVNRKILGEAKAQEAMGEEEEKLVLTELAARKAFGEITDWSGGEYSELEAEFLAATGEDRDPAKIIDVCKRAIAVAKKEKEDPDNEYSVSEIESWEQTFEQYLKDVEKELE
jgi:16S rRNA A1518/A1519 N6-dimethyltransferase RsmA/KsgA/DIM1 with predicted DNA glycosylase/AP lyase activity